MEENRQSAGLWHDRSRTSSPGQTHAQAHIDHLSERIAASRLCSAPCKPGVLLPGDDRPDCPILDDLAGGGLLK